MDSVALGPMSFPAGERTAELPPWLCLVSWEPSGHVGVEFRELCPELGEADDDLVRVAGLALGCLAFACLAFACLAFACLAFACLAAAGLCRPRLGGQLVNCLPELGDALNGGRTHDRIIRLGDVAPRWF